MERESPPVKAGFAALAPDGVVVYRAPSSARKYFIPRQRPAAELARGLDGTATSAVLSARTLGNLSLVSAWAGRRDEALDAADQAAHICRRHLSDAPDQLRSTLAHALDSLGSRLALLGRHRDAVAPATETVALFRQLALTDGAHRGDLARSLNNLGIRLCDADRHAEAHSASCEALDIRRSLYADDPDARGVCDSGSDLLGRHGAGGDHFPRSV